MWGCFKLGHSTSTHRRLKWTKTGEMFHCHVPDWPWSSWWVRDSPAEIKGFKWLNNPGIYHIVQSHIVRSQHHPKLWIRTLPGFQGLQVVFPSKYRVSVRSPIPTILRAQTLSDCSGPRVRRRFCDADAPEHSASWLQVFCLTHYQVILAAHCVAFSSRLGLPENVTPPKSHGLSSYLIEMAICWVYKPVHSVRIF